jgi:hypothetical protein
MNSVEPGKSVSEMLRSRFGESKRLEEMFEVLLAERRVAGTP